MDQLRLRRIARRESLAEPCRPPCILSDSYGEQSEDTRINYSMDYFASQWSNKYLCCILPPPCDYPSYSSHFSSAKQQQRTALFRLKGKTQAIVATSPRTTPYRVVL